MKSISVSQLAATITKGMKLRITSGLQQTGLAGDPLTHEVKKVIVRKVLRLRKAGKVNVHCQIMWDDGSMGSGFHFDLLTFRQLVEVL